MIKNLTKFWTSGQTGMPAQRQSIGGMALFAIGLTFFFIQVHLISMIVNDQRSLFLGSWDLYALLMFTGVVFFILPVVVFVLFLILDRVSPRLFMIVLSLAIAYAIARELDYFYLRVLLADGVELRIVILLILTVLGFFLTAAYFDKVFYAAKFLAPLSLVMMAYFWIETVPAFLYPTAPDDLARAEKSGGAKTPIFFLSFERVVYGHLVGKDGTIDAKLFPNFARLASRADVFHQAYANSTSTPVALEAMYSSKYPAWGPAGKLRSPVREFSASRQEEGGRQVTTLREIFEAEWRKIVFISDILTHYCNPRRHICINSRGFDKMSQRWALLKGWARAYLPIFVPADLAPEGVVARLSWVKALTAKLRWGTFVETDTADRRAIRALPTKERKKVVYGIVGNRQVDSLLSMLDREGDAPNVYVMHNLYHHEAGLETSGLWGRTEAEYAKDLKRAQKSMQDLDRMVGRILDKIEERGMFDRSLIVLVSDTGDDLAVNNNFIRGQSELPETPELSHIFLAIKRPFQKQGRDFNSPVTQVDILPTIMAHLELNPEKYDFDGIAVTDPDKKWGLKERPVFFFHRFNYAYELTRIGGPWRRIN